MKTVRPSGCEGDSVNDAPKLARAVVGSAIGAATDVGIQSAGLILASDDPRAALSVTKLSRASHRKMVQNLVVGDRLQRGRDPLAAGVLAWAASTLSPAVGDVLMSASTIVVAANAQLLRRVDLPQVLPPEESSGRVGTERPGPPRTSAASRWRVPAAPVDLNKCTTSRR